MDILSKAEVIKMRKIIIAISILALFFIAGCVQTEQEKAEKMGTTEQVIGGETDEHGCLIAAGYSWCESKQKCLRTWEEECSSETQEQTTEDGTGELGTGMLLMQITDKKPESLNITGLEITISDIKVHIAGVGGTTEETCTNETTTEEECTEQTIPEIIEACINETRIEEVCVNVTINGTNTTNETIEEICTNETIIEEICTNETINKTIEVCENITNTIEICDSESATGAGWFTIVEGPKTFDLIEIKDVKEFLGEKELTAGKYTQIRLTVESAKLMISGEEESLKIPSGSIKLVKNFNIVDGGTTTLTIDFDAEKSVHQAGSIYIIKPTIKVIQES